jgi:DNA-binding HxlR family transcriptional regulator
MQENAHRGNALENELRQGLDLVTEKWTVLVMHVLKGGTQRLSDLQREIEGISQKMLIQTLRKMEEDGLVARTVYPVVPPKVEYTLTPLGETLLKPLESLCQWTTEHLQEIQEARQRYRATVKAEALQKQVQRN